MDDLAHAVGKDPLEFRLNNLKDPRLRAVLEAAAAQFGGTAKPAADRGCGIAGGSDKGSYVATCAEVAVDRAGQAASRATGDRLRMRRREPRSLEEPGRGGGRHGPGGVFRGDPL